MVWFFFLSQQNVKKRLKKVNEMENMGTCLFDPSEVIFFRM